MVRRSTVLLIEVLITALALLSTEVWLLQKHGAELQKQDCAVAPWMQSWVPLSAFWIGVMRVIHRNMDSFIWLALSVGMLAFNDRAGNLYIYILVGHVLKNSLKSAILSPRGFWFCDEDSGVLYCGKGYSLPSGHSMMSLSVILYLLWRWPKAWLLCVLLPLLLFIWCEVLYLGTHTRWDVIIGVTTGIAYFAAFHLFQPKVLMWLRQAQPWQMIVSAIGVICLMLVLEFAEDEIDRHHVIPDEWQQTYEKNCHLAEGTGAQGMHLRSGYDKSALVMGLMWACTIRRVWQHEAWSRPLARQSMSMRVATALASAGSYHYIRLAIADLINPLVVSVGEPIKGLVLKQFLPALLQPIAALVLLPWIFWRIRRIDMLF